ncbi:MAG: RlmE family RNA methyltransferase [Bdellovibrionaceae bacterium]|nr:RlmE family RNA methyltransferase [Pseudobdellovibrionaceae bacterium]
MAFNPKDHYFKKAKKENFVARSIYKLDEIDKKLRLIKSGDRVLDLGASPGSWSQYASAKVGDRGVVLGVDLSPVTVSMKNSEFLQGNALEMDWKTILEERGLADGFNIVMSDMAPKTTGIRMTDQARSTELCMWALDIALERLKPHGHFICKLFHSDDFQLLKKRIVENFAKFEAVKPHSTRSQSKEIFLVGIDRKKT